VRNKRWEEYSITPEISHIPDTNFWHYSLQLNTYKAILEKNYGKKVTKLCLVCLYPTQKSYKLFEVPDLKEEIEELFNIRKNKYKKLK
jgi:CRISPR/Cas system-associated exonuclease Cas4 (RecB family)